MVIRKGFPFNPKISILVGVQKIIWETVAVQVTSCKSKSVLRMAVFLVTSELLNMFALSYFGAAKKRHEQNWVFDIIWYYRKALWKNYG